MNLGNLLHEAASRNPQKTALICGNEVVTYRELDQATASLAAWFLREGLRRGDRVGIHWSNSIQAVKLFFACFKAGLIAVPVNIRLKTPEVAYILGHSRAVMCFSQPELAAMVQDAPGECRIYTDLPALEEQRSEEVEVDGDQPAIVLYTSGTTARPKGVTHTHATLLSTAELMWSIGLDGGHTVLMITSMMHASGISCQIVPGLLSGATLVLISAFDPPSVLDAMERWQCSFSFGLPAMMQLLVEEQSRRPRDAGSLRIWLSGGDTVPVSLQERFQALFGIPLLEVYGMTESAPICCNPPRATRLGSIGRRLNGMETQVLDLFGEDVPEGEVGELAVQSPANFVGYWDNPKATTDALRDGWLHTGDLVRRDSDGYFRFEGRKKEIIIRGGSNISPQEVEEALFRHPAVFEAGVIGTPDPVYGESVVAFVSLRNGHRTTEEQLRDFTRQRLADYRIPERVLFLPELPKNVTGKVQRRALKEMAISQPDLAEQGVVAGV